MVTKPREEKTYPGPLVTQGMTREIWILYTYVPLSLYSYDSGSSNLYLLFLIQLHVYAVHLYLYTCIHVFDIYANLQYSVFLKSINLPKFTKIMCKTLLLLPGIYTYV